MKIADEVEVPVETLSGKVEIVAVELSASITRGEESVSELEETTAWEAAAMEARMVG